MSEPVVLLGLPQVAKRLGVSVATAWRQLDNPYRMPPHDFVVSTNYRPRPLWREETVDSWLLNREERADA